MEYNHSPAASIQAKRENAKSLGQAWAKQVNAENAWQRLVLTLDGGGIRGYSELLILQELMRRIVECELRINNQVVNIDEVLPCHYFDYMWGTSTGGLIVLMLARLRMSITQALDVYRTLGDSIFGTTRPENFGGLNPFATKYKYEKLKEAVVQITKNYCKLHNSHEENTCGGHDTLLWPAQLEVNNNWDICQAVCITARAGQGTSQALPLRSYEYQHPNALVSLDPYAEVQDLDLAIWEAGRATSAAPFYFKMFEKPDAAGRMRRYKDGGVVLNNPAEIALDEVMDRYFGHDIQAVPQRLIPAVLLSIGTGIRSNTPFATLSTKKGKREDVSFFKGLWRRLKASFNENKAILKHVLVRYTEGEAIHRMLRHSMAGNEHTWYRRLNVDRGLGEMKLGEWRAGDWHNPATGQIEHHSGGATLTRLESATKTYLEREELRVEHDIEWNLLPTEHLDQVAERLVRHRSERRRLITTEAERKRWHTHQGRWVTGVRSEPWDDFSCDGPIPQRVADAVS